MAQLATARSREGSPLVSFRAGGLLPALDARLDEASGEGRGLVAKRDLGRLYDLIDREARALGLFDAEFRLVCDAADGTCWEPSSIPLLWAEVDEAIAGDGLAAKWGVDGPGLVAKLRALGPLRSLALVDRVERYWRSGAARSGRTLPPEDASR